MREERRGQLFLCLFKLWVTEHQSRQSLLRCHLIQPPNFIDEKTEARRGEGKPPWSFSFSWVLLASEGARATVVSKGAPHKVFLHPQRKEGLGQGNYAAVWDSHTHTPQPHARRNKIGLSKPVQVRLLQPKQRAESQKRCTVLTQTRNIGNAPGWRSQPVRNQSFRVRVIGSFFLGCCWQGMWASHRQNWPPNK